MTVLLMSKIRFLAFRKKIRREAAGVSSLC